MYNVSKAFASGSALESIALKAATVPILLLQKPSRKSKAKDHTSCLARRLKSWEVGDLNELVIEGRMIQQRKSSPFESDEHLARPFSKLMLQGKTKAALRLLTIQGKGGVLSLNDTVNIPNQEQNTVKDILTEKHPPGQPANPDSIVDTVPSSIHPVL